jgi:hypothetical protein
VGDDQRAGAARADRVGEQRQDAGGGRGVEIAGRLVGQDQRGIMNQRARDRDPLKLPARQVLREVPPAGAEPDHVEQRVGAGKPARPVARGERERERDILAQRQIGQDVERLKHEADAVAAQRVRRASSSVPRSTPSIAMRPVSARSRPATTLSRVDLPTPDSPMIAISSPGAGVEGEPAEQRAAAGHALRQVRDVQHGRHGRGGGIGRHWRCGSFPAVPDARTRDRRLWVRAQRRIAWAGR